MSKLEKLLNKVSRRSSDTSIEGFKNPSIIISGDGSPRSIRSRARSLSMMSNHSNSNVSLAPIVSDDGRIKGRSKSVSKKHTKELIKMETKLVVLKKLSVLLNDLGLQNPVMVKSVKSNSSSLSKHVNIYVANSNNCIYLPPATSASFTYEDVENGGMPEDSNIHIDADEDAEVDHEMDDPAWVTLDNDEIVPDPYSKHIPAEMKTKLGSQKSPNYLCTKIDSDTPIPHTFGVVIELNKETALSNVEFELCSICNILWPSGDPYNKTFAKEKFKIGKMVWNSNLNNADFYINNLNSNDFKVKKMDPQELARRTKYYRLKDIKECSSNQYFDLDDNDSTDLFSSNSVNEDGHQIFKAGIYVFVLPVLFPEHIPPSINSINGSLTHCISVSMHKISEKLNRKLNLQGSFELPMVRTPPSLVSSIAKPIYVNRIWNDALHYIITFPRKYVPLGSEHVINVKVVPLVKDVIIKRIKFNVLERITYMSRDMSKEYDYDGEDPYYLKPMLGDSKYRERVIPVCELKTKNKPTAGYNEPYKEEVIKCPDNNLLFSCYEPDPNSLHDDDIENFRLDDPMGRSRFHFHSPSSVKSKSRVSSPTPETDNTMIASPLDINIALPFLTTRTDKVTPSANGDDDWKHSIVSPNSSRKASIVSDSGLNSTNFTPSSPIIGALATNLSHNHNELLTREEQVDFLTPDSTALMHETSHNHIKENIQQGFTTVTRALYPDSNFRHIQIYHRLQVCFRISKPDPKDDYKMHHYEVVVDTPLILLSSKCNDESIQLPKYDETVEGRPPLNSSISFRTPNYDKSKDSANKSTTIENSVGYSESRGGEVHGDGFSIKPWNQTQIDDTLPTFEEATSPVSSPITRSFSVAEDPLSRIPSISIDGNAIPFPSNDPPAYEDETGSGDIPSYSPLNIDAVVNQSTTSDSSNTVRSSRLKSSLVQSFAPSSLNYSNLVSNSMLSVSPTDTSTYPDIPVLNQANKPDGTLGPSKLVNSNSFVSLSSDPPTAAVDSSDSLQTSGSTRASNSTAESSSTRESHLTGDSNSSGESNFSEASVNTPDVLSTEVTTTTTTDASSQNDRDALPMTKDDTLNSLKKLSIHSEEDSNIEAVQKVYESTDPATGESTDKVNSENFSNFPNDSEGNLSVLTHGSAFDQRLPLLRNYSTESSLPLARQTTVLTHHKYSTDNLV